MYISGFLLAVPTANKEAYRKMAADAGPYFESLGAIEMVEAWEEDVRDGKVTDFRRAVQAKDDESIVFSWVIWPDRATSDAAEKKMLDDDGPEHGEMPFDGQRMIFGGFSPIFTQGRGD